MYLKLLELADQKIFNAYEPSQSLEERLGNPVSRIVYIVPDPEPRDFRHCPITPIEFRPPDAWDDFDILGVAEKVMREGSISAVAFGKPVDFIFTGQVDLDGGDCGRATESNTYYNNRRLKSGSGSQPAGAGNAGRSKC